MNIVFWILIVMALVCIWGIFSSIFKDIGQYIIDTINQIEQEMFDDDEEGDN